MQLLLVNFVCLISRAKVQHMFFLFTWTDTVSQTDLKKFLCRRQITSSFEENPVPGDIDYFKDFREESSTQGDELFHSLFHKNPVPGEMNYFTFFATKSRTRGHWLFQVFSRRILCPGTLIISLSFSQKSRTRRDELFQAFSRKSRARGDELFQGFHQISCTQGHELFSDNPNWLKMIFDPKWTPP